MQPTSNVNILLRFRPFVSDSEYRWYLYRNEGRFAWCFSNWA